MLQSCDLVSEVPASGSLPSAALGERGHRSLLGHGIAVCWRAIQVLQKFHDKKEPLAGAGGSVRTGEGCYSEER
jgi:hypothetical protein